MKYLRWFLESTKGIRANIVFRIVIGLLQAVIGLYVVWLSRNFIDVTIKEGGDNEVIFNAGVLFLCVGFAVLIRQLYYFMTIKANTNQSNSLRKRIYTKLFSYPLFSKESLHSADVASRLSKDIELVSEVSTDILPQVFIIGFQLLGAFFLMRFFDSRLAWLLVLITPLTAALGKFISYKLRSLTLQIREKESGVQMCVQESIEQNAVLRTLCCEDYLTNRLQQMQTQLRDKIIKRASFTSLIRILLGLTFSFGYMTAFVWGGLQLKNGSITFGTMTSFLQLVGLIQGPILTLLNYLPKVVQATASIDRLEQTNAESKTLEKPLQANPKALGIEFSKVSFKYDGKEEYVLKNFSHTFPPCSKTAVTGTTGAGKTTLFRLILSLAEPLEGNIFLYDEFSKNPVNERYRENFVFVPQGNTLVSGTIRYNLLLANPNVDDKMLKQVLHTACADFVFDLPLGLDTDLKERGGGLSEGQAQRIAIARGLLRPGKVFLLDEISSSLDENTEKELFRRLFENYQDRTMIFITHRPEVKKMCSYSLDLLN